MSDLLNDIPEDDKAKIHFAQHVLYEALGAMAQLLQTLESDNANLRMLRYHGALLALAGELDIELDKDAPWADLKAEHDAQMASLNN
jgi:hypothetical protein